MKLLCTGGAGYIGSHTIFQLLKQTSFQIVVLDDLRTGFLQNVTYLEQCYPNRITFMQFDLGDKTKLEALFANTRFDAILHFSASLIVSESVEYPLQYYQNNVANALGLIDCCVRYGVQYFIFSSTAAVYGEPDFIGQAIDEKTPLAPINPYGASKMMVERILRDVSEASSLRYVALRYFNVAGACMDNTADLLANNMGLGQRSKNATHLIKVALECATAKRASMNIFGTDYPTVDGTCIRDYIHIDDLANAHLSALEYLSDTGKSEVFNVGYSHGYSVKEVIECAKKISGVDFCALPAAKRAGDPAALIASNAKLLALTSWKPRFNNLETIIRSAYEWECALKS